MLTKRNFTEEIEKDMAKSALFFELRDSVADLTLDDAVEVVKESLGTRAEQLKEKL